MAKKLSSEILASDLFLNEVVERLVGVFQPESIYLFGSMAREDEGPDSDYDIMVVLTQSAEPRYRRAQLAQRALWGLARGADVLVLTRTEFDESRLVVCSLTATVLREGKELYAA